MGTTSKTLSVIEPLIRELNIKSVCDLGAQNLYTDEIIRTNPDKYPYASEWYIARGIEYLSIDLNGENESKKWDLDKPIRTKLTFDMVNDFGTSEHCHNYFQVLKNIHKLCKVGGIIVHENPEIGSWPGHGNNYVTEEFYHQFCAVTEYSLLQIERWPAMGNNKDGWNIIAVMQKRKEEFITEDQLPKYYTA
jgi:hypothetical protein